MATAKQKITLNASRDIPFNKLVLSQANVRRIKNGQTIEGLAASIARRGLLQSLNVRPVLDGENNETGMFEVPAGGRRYRALELLVKQKRMAKTELVPCVVTDAHSEVPIAEDSLAENFDREDLHPLDMFRAFQDLHEQGASHEDIAARFFVTATFVQQRLRLARVSPTLLDLYEQDGITLEQLMAFTVSSDHARQEQVWESLQNSWSKEPYQIRRMLTETTVRASDKRALFVGLDAYEAAGGTVLRDLFEDDDGGWLQDPALLDRLVADKLKAAADTVAAEGWRWIEVAVSHPYGATNGLRQLDGTPTDLTEAEQANIDALTAEYDRVEAEYEDADELPDEVDERLGEIERQLAVFDSKPVSYDPTEIARAGVFVGIDREGALDIARGYVRPEDEAADPADGDDIVDPAQPAETGTPQIHGTTITIGGKPMDAEEEEDDAIKPLPERLVTELTAYRTVALQDAVAGNPHVAVTALLHKLVTDIFHHRSSVSCLEASVHRVYFTAQPDALKDGLPAKSIEGRHEAWASDLPGDENDLWTWLDLLDEASRMALLAHCVGYGVNALFERADRYGGGISAHGVEQRLAQADRLARAVGLDMVDAGWRPSVDNYLGRVTKLRILEAVREARGEQAAQLIDHLKKPEMAKEAERLLAETGWLPEPLRLADLDGDAASGTTLETDGAEQPAFLADDGEDSPDVDDDAPAVAAE